MRNLTIDDIDNVEYLFYLYDDQGPEWDYGGPEGAGSGILIPCAEMAKTMTTAAAPVAAAPVAAPAVAVPRLLLPPRPLLLLLLLLLHQRRLPPMSRRRRKSRTNRTSRERARNKNVKKYQTEQE
jgi:hypothetical protein